MLAVAVSGQSERQILVTPHAEHPQIAKDSGLGGRVTVNLTVDASGNVVSIDSVSGPDSVCPSVTRPDVVALRESARTAAANAKFAPSDGSIASSIQSVTFDFPSGASEKQFTAAGAPPLDSSGPVAVAGSGPRVPKQISGGVLNGKAVSLPKPPYPPAARAVRASGAVTIQVLIIEDGSVFSAAATSGHPLLRSAARTAACGAEFSPTLLMGNPVKIHGVITYNFVP
jgi:TonB family protein